MKPMGVLEAFYPHQFTLGAILAAALVTCLCSCGPTYDEKQAKEQAMQETQRQQAKRDHDDLLGRVGAHFGATIFPDANIVLGSLTIELQDFLRRIAGKPVVFDALLEDIEETPEGVMVTASRPLAESSLRDKRRVVFRLKSSAAQVKRMISSRQKRQRGPYLSTLPNCVIVARVESFGRIRRYETHGRSVTEDIVELSIESPERFIARGRLLEIASMEDL